MKGGRDHESSYCCRCYCCCYYCCHSIYRHQTEKEVTQTRITREKATDRMNSFACCFFHLLGRNFRINNSLTLIKHFLNIKAIRYNHQSQQGYDYLEK